MPAQFSAKLTYLREQRGLTQADLTRRLGVRRAHISNLENGRRAPSLDFVIRTAALFHVSVDYLLRDAPDVREVPDPIEWPEDIVAQPGEHLRLLRINRGLRQSDLAAGLGLKTQAHISLIESGQKVPSLSLLVTIADYFGVSVDEVLFGGESSLNEENER